MRPTSSCELRLRAKLKSASQAYVYQDGLAGGVHQLLMWALELMLAGFHGVSLAGAIAKKTGKPGIPFVKFRVTTAIVSLY